MTGLYDGQGVLRFSGRDQADCLAYAELFNLAPGSFSLEPLLPVAAVALEECRAALAVG